MGKTRFGVGAAVLLLATALSAAPVTKTQLLEMGRARVDSKVMLAIVERDCVDFDVDGANAVELSKEVPAEVLEAAIRCREKSTGPAAAPPAASPRLAPAEAPTPAPDEKPSAAGRPVLAGSPAPDVRTGSLQVTADFISETGPLACELVLDGKPWTTLAKPAQGKFGEAVERAPYPVSTEPVELAPGSHTLGWRCDPMKEARVETVTVAPAARTTFELHETMFKHWKARKDAETPTSSGP